MQDFAQFYNKNHNIKGKALFQNKQFITPIKPQQLNQQQSDSGQQQQQQYSQSAQQLSNQQETNVDVLQLVSELEKMTILYENTLKESKKKDFQINSLINQNKQLNEIIDRDALSPSKYEYGANIEDLNKAIIQIKTKNKILENDNNYLNGLVDQLRDDKQNQTMEGVDKQNLIKVQKQQITNYREQLQKNIEFVNQNDNRIELQNHKNEIHILQTKIKEQQQQIKTFIEENEKLGRYMEEKEQEAQRDNQQQKIQELKVLIEAFKTDNQSLKEHLQNRENDILTLRSDYDNEILEFKKKLSFVSSFEDANQKLKSENKKLKSESYGVHKLNQKISEQNDKIQSLTNSLHAVNSEKAQMIQIIEQKKRENEQLEECKLLNSDWETKVKELILENQNLCNYLDDRNNEIKNLKQNIQHQQNCQSRRDSPIKSISDPNILQEKQQQQIDDLNWKIKTLTDEIQFKNQKLRNSDERESENQMENQKLKNQIHILQESLNLLQQQNSIQNQQYQQNSQQSSQLNSQRSVMNNSSYQNLDQINEFIQKMEDIRNEQMKHMETMQQKVKGKEKEIQQLQKNSVLKDSLISKKDLEIQGLKNQNQNLQDLNDNLQNKLMEQYHIGNSSSNKGLVVINSQNEYDSISNSLQQFENNNLQSLNYLQNLKNSIEQIQKQDKLNIQSLLQSDNQNKNEKQVTQRSENQEFDQSLQNEEPSQQQLQYSEENSDFKQRDLFISPNKINQNFQQNQENENENQQLQQLQQQQLQDSEEKNDQQQFQNNLQQNLGKQQEQQFQQTSISDKMQHESTF